jgi:hypothetical protein
VEWKFPVEIVSAVRENYLTRESDYDNRFACLVNVASWMTMQAHLGLIGETNYWNLTPRKLKALDCNEAHLCTIGGAVLVEFEQLRKSL